jgi:hypothetical protein
VVAKVIFGMVINYICKPTTPGKEKENHAILLSKEKNVQVSDTTMLAHDQMLVTKIIFSL